MSSWLKVRRGSPCVWSLSFLQTMGIFIPWYLWAPRYCGLHYAIPTDNGSSKPQWTSWNHHRCCSPPGLVFLRKNEMPPNTSRYGVISTDADAFVYLAITYRIHSSMDIVKTIYCQLIPDLTLRRTWFDPLPAVPRFSITCLCKLELHARVHLCWLQPY